MSKSTDNKGKALQTVFKFLLNENIDNSMEIVKLHSIIHNNIKIAKKDLSMWLHYAGVKTVNEFNLKSEKIKEKSFHKYNDVIDHLKYIKKLESLNV